MACAGTIERREACVCDVTIFPLVKIKKNLCFPWTRCGHTRERACLEHKRTWISPEMEKVSTRAEAGRELPVLWELLLDRAGGRSSNTHKKKH